MHTCLFFALESKAQNLRRDPHKEPDSRSDPRPADLDLEGARGGRLQRHRGANRPPKRHRHQYQGQWQCQLQRGDAYPVLVKHIHEKLVERHDRGPNCGRGRAPRHRLRRTQSEI